MGHRMSVDWDDAVQRAMEGGKVQHTGINGWVHLDKKIVHFTPRCNHLNWLDESRGPDGVKICALDGIVGSRRKPVEEGGARLSNGRMDIYDIYSWAADRFGWRQFINLDEHIKTRKLPRVQIFGQYHPEGENFARTIGSDNFIFKDDYVWPREHLRPTAAELEAIENFKSREAQSEQDAQSDFDMPSYP